jgi:hypothetical protein
VPLMLANAFPEHKWVPWCFKAVQGTWDSEETRREFVQHPVFVLSLFDFRFSIFDFRFSISDFRFSLFAFRFSLFAFRFSLFAFRFSLLFAHSA